MCTSLFVWHSSVKVHSKKTPKQNTITTQEVQTTFLAPISQSDSLRFKAKPNDRIKFLLFEYPSRLPDGRSFNSGFELQVMKDQLAGWSSVTPSQLSSDHLVLERQTTTQLHRWEATHRNCCQRRWKVQERRPGTLHQRLISDRQVVSS